MRAEIFNSTFILTNDRGENMSGKNNSHRCDAVWAPSKEMKLQCMLPEGHDEDHMWLITWKGEDEDVME